MEIGPIFRALINQRSRFWLITIEIALTLAVVANCITMIKEQRAEMLRPTGMDVDGILVITAEPFAESFDQPAFREDVYDEDLRTLRALPGVRAATSLTALPLSGGGSATGRKPVDSERDPVTAPYYVAGDQVLEALGVELIAGRDFLPAEHARQDVERGDYGESEGEAPATTVIVTQELADVIFPDGDALGQQISAGSGDDVATIVGIVGQMQCSWPQSSVADRVMLIPGRPVGSRRTLYLIRAEPGAVDRLYASLEDEMLGVSDGRIVTVGTLAEIKADTYADVTATVQLLGGLSVLLIVVTSMGIVGLTAFSVTQRTHEIGTRRALGATKLAILRYFLVENWLMTGVGLALGLLLTFTLNFALSHWADVPRIGAAQIVSGMGLLWAIGLMAALLPALRGMKVSPVTATRNLY